MSADSELLDQIDSLLVNIEFNANSIYHVILESTAFQRDPHAIIFYLLSKLIPIDIPVDIPLISGLNLGEDESDKRITGNAFLRDQFLMSVLEMSIDQLRESIEDYVTSLFTNTKLQNDKHLLNLIIQISFYLNQQNSQSICVELITNLKLFITELYFQLCICSSINCMVLAHSEVSDTLMKELLKILDCSGCDEKYIVANQLIKLYFKIAQTGPINSHLLLQVLTKINMKKDKMSKIFWENLLFSLNNINSRENDNNNNNVDGSYNSIENSQNFLIFNKESLIEFDYLKLSKDGFTIQTWIKFEKSYTNVDSIDENVQEEQDQEEPILFLKFRNNEGQIIWNLSVKGKFLILEVVEKNGHLVKRTFSNFEVDFIQDVSSYSSKLYNIVLINKFHQINLSLRSTSSLVYLIVDGKFVQSVSVPISSLNTNNREISVQFGNMSKEADGNCKNSIGMANLLLMNQVQSHQWITLNYLLGPNYHHNYRDTNILKKFLSYRSLTAFELQCESDFKMISINKNNEKFSDYERMNAKLFEDIIKKNRSMNFSDTFGDEVSVSDRIGNFMFPSDKISLILNFHARNIVIQNQYNDENFTLNPVNHHVLNTVYNSVNNINLNSKLKGKIHKGTINYYYSNKGNNLLSFCYSSDLISILLKQIEGLGKLDKSLLIIFLRILFCLISKNFVFAKEIEESGGYHILSIILKSKPEIMDIDILDIFLEFTGYKHQNPIDSVINNSIAYKSLIVDFDLWKKSDGDTYKFLLFQFTVFSQDSKYYEYNVTKIVKMKIMRRFIHALKCNFFKEDMLPSVSNTLLTLIKSNPTQEMFHTVAMYIMYAININKHHITDPTLIADTELQRKCGRCILELMLQIISDQQLLPPTVFRKIVKSVTVRWMTLLMDGTNLEISLLSLKLLIKMFSFLGAHYYEGFTKIHGFISLKRLLSVHCTGDRANELIVVTFAASFGASQLDNLGESMLDYCKRLARRDRVLRLAMSDFLSLTIDLCGSRADTLDNLTNCFEFAFKHISCIHVILKLPRWISKICEVTFKSITSGNTRLACSSEKLIERVLKLMVVTFIYSPDESYMLIENLQQNDIFQKLMVSKVYPHVIETINKDLKSENNMKFQHKNICKNVCKLLLQASSSTLNFIWEKPHLNLLQETLTLFIEKVKNGFEPHSVTLKSLRKYLAKLTLERLFVLVYSQKPDENDELKSFVMLLLYNQELFFGPGTFDSEGISSVILFLFHAIRDDMDYEEKSIIMNCLRIMFMFRHADFELLAKSIGSDEFEPISHFFESLLVLNDEAIIERLEKDTFIKTSLQKTLFNYFEKFEMGFLNLPSVNDYLNNSSNADLTSKKEAFEIQKFLQFHSENVNWKASIISSEISKYFRHFQDQKDNSQFFITNFNKLKIEIDRILNEPSNSKQKWVVDNIESSGRIRKRIIPKDELSIEDQLLYDIEVPISSNDNLEVSSLLESQVELDHEAHSLFTSVSNSDEIDVDNEESFQMVEDSAAFNRSQEDKNRKVLRSLFVGDKITYLWNVSQLIGLEAEEGILILGESHIYLIENYFHCDNDEVVDIDDAPSGSRDQYLQLITGQPKLSKLKQPQKSHNTKSWELERLTTVSKRQFLLRDVAIEFFFANGSSFLIICKNSKERDNIHSRMSCKTRSTNIDNDLLIALKSANNKPSDINKVSATRSFASKLASAITNNNKSFQTITERWKEGKISNFYYLMLVNTIAGRTFNDLTQYPVFPWVIADYTSEELDFSKPSTFRDLSKPMGAQGYKRCQQFKERYDALKSLNDPGAIPFHYGTHYSSAMIVTSFLIRLEPYVQSYLLLQGGKFDHADRLFYSIEKAWNSAAIDNYADVRELIPEFFYLTEFLVNSNNFQLGELQTGEAVSDVILPPWAHNDPKIFIQKQKEALESEYVSAHLHEWIDLIFGFKQQGELAIESRNVFHHLSYSGAINLDSIDDVVERRAVTGIIHNFGQTPLQVFSKSHPMRNYVQKSAKLEIFRLQDIPTINKVTHLPINNLELYFEGYENVFCWKAKPSLVSLTDNLKISPGFSYSSLSVNNALFENLHFGNITNLVPIGERSFLTGSEDGTINIWKFPINSSRFLTVNSSPLLSQFRFQEELEFKKTLRGHFSAIKEIRVSKEFNVAISLDELGTVYFWDLVRYKFIRELKSEKDNSVIKHINISTSTGMICLASDYEINIYTINGTFITSESFPQKVTCLSFPTRKVGFINHNNFDLIRVEESHEYWSVSEMLAIGMLDNTISTLSILLSQGKWIMIPIGNFKIRDKTGDVIKTKSSITCIAMNLFSIQKGKENYVTAEIACGDSYGHLIKWS